MKLIDYGIVNFERHITQVTQAREMREGIDIETGVVAMHSTEVLPMTYEA